MSLIRELGAAERIYCREQTDYGNQTLVQVLIISNTIPISEARARQALVELYEDFFAILGYEMCPSDDGKTLVYRAKEACHAKEDLISSFKYEQGLDWHTVFENELNLPFDDSKLTRWILIDGHILVMSFHHVLVDAKNLFYIGQRYLSLCLTSSNDRKQLVHLEPMEKYLFNRYSFEPISDLDLKPRPKRPDPLVSQTGACHFYVSDPILSRLKDQCHRHQIRLNSILTVVSATGYYLARNVSHEERLKIHMMVNIRPQLDLDYESTGMFATVFDCFLLLDARSVSSLWSNAIQQHDDLHRRINAKEYIANCKNDTDLLRMINNDESFSSDDVHFAFSNLGLLCKTQENQLEEHYFGVSLIEQRWTSSILLGISTIENRLCFTITYNRNIVSKAFVNEWIEKIYYVLEQM